MMDANNAWTTTHDLALLYLALAYGTDYDLSDKEVGLIKEALQAYDDLDELALNEIIVEVMAVLLEETARTEVRHAIERLGDTLSDAELSAVLDQVVRIARADGILLQREQHFINTLARAWSLRGLDVPSPSAPPKDWTLLHLMAFVYVVVAHSTDDELSAAEIEAIVSRLQEWEADLDETAARALLREVLPVYAQEPGEAMLGKTIQAIKESLPPMRRLILLDDLYYIAYADGTFTERERTMITSLGEAWGVNVRLNGSLPDSEAPAS